MATSLVVPIRECAACAGTVYLYGPGVEHVGRRTHVDHPTQVEIDRRIQAVWVCSRCDGATDLDGNWRGLISPVHASGGCDCADRQAAERAAAERRKYDA